MNNDTLLNEFNEFACGLNVAQKAQELTEQKIWEVILNSFKTKEV